MVGFQLQSTLDLLARLGMASALGALLGAEREIRGHWAGLRTHMLVSLGSAIFVATGIELTTSAIGPTGDPRVIADVTRVIQGVASGIGFLGAGTILKLGDRMEIRGLTTASSIFLAAAVGTAAGCALYMLAAIGSGLALVVLATLRPVERLFERRAAENRASRANRGY